MHSSLSTPSFTGKITINAYQKKDEDKIFNALKQNPQLVQDVKNTPFDVIFNVRRDIYVTCKVVPENSNQTENNDNSLVLLGKDSLALIYIRTGAFAKKCLQYVLKNQSNLEEKMNKLQKGDY
ncbi:MAG: hypothetical protein AB7V50_10755 [Vampirovibrionia bacterium]